MKKYLLPIARICFALLFAFSAKYFCTKQTDGFTIYNITAELPPIKEIFIASDQNEIDPLLPIFDQPFTYLAKGAQCYAFLSQDGKYVIKFVKKRLFMVPEFYRYIPFYGNFYDERKIHKEKKRIHEFTSYGIALRNLSSETGLIYLHLNKPSHLNKKITLIDRLNISHEVDLDKTEFILQKRGTLIYDELGTLREKNQLEEAKRLITALCHLMQSRSEKAIVDRDPNISKNFAVIDSHPIQIDIGRFSYASEDDMKNLRNLSRMQRDFRGWLLSNYPDLVDHFDQEFAKLIEQGCY